MKEIRGLSNKVLEVDLNSNSWKTVLVSEEDTRDYLGGKGMVIKLLYNRLKPGVDPLSEENIIAFHTGAFLGTGAPCSARFSAGAKSPQTGIIATSSCGGPFGMALKTSGWDGLILRGRSDKPTWLKIDSNGVEFNSANDISGMTTTEVQDHLGSYGSGMIAIGPAGEKMVRIANIISGHRFFGRAGLGAVLGSKNIKAVVAQGKEYKIVAADPDRFKKIRAKFLKDSGKNAFTGNDYRKYGTNNYVRLSQKNGMLPVNNFTDGSHPDFENISGQTFNRDYTTGHSTCKPCIIMCGHKGEFDGEKMQVPEYETTGLLGSNLGIFDPIAIAKWNNICKDLGFDTISAGSAIGWTMEAAQKGLIESDLKFGINDHIAETLSDIGMKQGIGAELGNGTRWLSDKYGGSEFAIHVKGLETAAYDPRGAIGHGLALATANRGACHLEASMMVIQAFEGFSGRYNSSGVAYQVAWFENLFSAINNLQTCQFTSNSVVGERPIVKILPRWVIRLTNLIAPQIALGIISLSQYNRLWSSITGIKLSRKQLLESGARTHLLERYMNTREGISVKDDRLPDRFTKEWRISDQKMRVLNIYTMLRRYYKHRGYDSYGVPGPQVLRKFGI